MGRSTSTYAYRDLDEEFFMFTDDFEHVYHPQKSPTRYPLAFISSSCASAMKVHNSSSLSESAMLRKYQDHAILTKQQRRRKLIGGGLFLLLALLGALPIILQEVQRSNMSNEKNSLEIALAAPYKALRGDKANARQSYSAIVSDEDLRIDRPDKEDPVVGAYDPHDLDSAVEDELLSTPRLGELVDEDTEDEPLEEGASEEYLTDMEEIDEQQNVLYGNDSED